MGRHKKKDTGGLSRSGLRRLLFGGAIIVGIALLVFAVVFLARPKLLWYVDEDLSASWTRILRDEDIPFSRYEIKSRQADAPFPGGRYGFIVSRKGPQGERAENAPLVLYHNLARSREYDGWMAIALDPWMVFRKHQDPEPSRIFLSLNNERGSLLLAGADQSAVQAWLFQLLQNEPGVFTTDSELWQTGPRELISEYPFQSGAFSYSWIQLWPLLFRNETASIYAPLSQARALPPFRAGGLAASRFPSPENWTRYGLQADILWAQTQANEKQRSRPDFSAAEKWLNDPKTQTVIANVLEWIPAHPSGVPYNTVSWEAQMAWIRSSYIWQGAQNVRN